MYAIRSESELLTIQLFIKPKTSIMNSMVPNRIDSHGIEKNLEHKLFCMK